MQADAYALSGWDIAGVACAKGAVTILPYKETCGNVALAIASLATLIIGSGPQVAHSVPNT